MPQQHKIRRQVVELSARDEATWLNLQERISRIHRSRIVPLIDRCCSDVSDPDTTHRIESLCVDLGSIDSARFEDDLMQRLEVRLRETLATSIRTGAAQTGADGVPSDIAARQELITVYARTGALPWWADTSRPEIVDESVRMLSRRAPMLLRNTLRELAGERRHVHRLVLNLGDVRLSELVTSLVPASHMGRPATQLPRELVDALSATTDLARESPARLRSTTWEAVIETACVDGGNRPLQSFWRQVLVRIAIDRGVGYGTLVTRLHRGLDQRRSAAREQLTGIVEALYEQLPGDVGERGAPAGRIGNPTDASIGEIDLILARHQDAAGPLAGIFAAMRAAAGRLADQERTDWLAVLRALGRPGTPLDLGSPVTAHRLAQAIRPVPRRRLLPASVLQRCRDEVSAAAAEDGRREIAMALREVLDVALATASADRRAARDSFDSPVSEPSELHVDNSGVVILWPFLERFFERLGLLTDRRFRDVESSDRAAGLLHYVAWKDQTAPEYALSLNKVLCGLHPHDVVEPGPALAAEETDEAEHLLSAAIVHAPNLGSLSTAGLRGSFLLRPGVLRARDGAWLLHVERRSYDVVLDRLPWSIGWVSLPWMGVPLRVEW